MVRPSGCARSAATRPILLDCVPCLIHIYAMTDPFMWLLRVGEFLHGFGYWSKWCAHARVLLLLAGERANAPDVERGKRELEYQKHAMSRKIKETMIMRNITIYEIIHSHTSTSNAIFFCICGSVTLCLLCAKKSFTKRLDVHIYVFMWIVINKRL